MDGILIIDKPAGMTSHDVVIRVRRALKTRRVGHTGTLDPFATGVIVVLVGRATRLAQFLNKDVKEYVATMDFGFETDTGDATGERREVFTGEGRDAVTLGELQDAIADLRGEIEQIPPMYSAKKVAGRKLYELARRGEVVERQAVKVTVHEIEVVPGQRVSLPGSNEMCDVRSADIRVVCSAGTYIRTLAEDIGRKVGVGAHLRELRRTRAGRFTSGDAIGLDQLERLATPASSLLDMQAAVEHLPAFELSEDRAARTLQGLSTRAAEGAFPNGQPVRMFAAGGDLIAIGTYDAAENTIRPKVVLV